MAGSSWPTLTAGARARASDVEAKLDWLEGHLLPMNSGTTTDAIYDLGTSTARWNNLHLAADVYMANNKNVYMKDSGGTNRAVLNVSAANLVNIGTTAGFSDVAFSPGSAEKMRLTKTGELGIGTTSPNTSCLLDITGTRAVRLPRLSTTERDALTGAEGMVIYNSTTTKIQKYENGAWQNMGGSDIGAVAKVRATNSGVSNTDVLNITAVGRLLNLRSVGQADINPLTTLTLDGTAYAELTGNSATAYFYAFDTGDTTGTFNLTTATHRIDTNFKTSIRVQHRASAAVGQTAITGIAYERT